MELIDYTDKVALYQNNDIADINKVNASDMNKIKSVVNGALQGTNTMGNVVVDGIRTKNIFGEYVIINGWLSGTTMRVNSANGNLMAFIPCKASTTYTISRSVVTSSFRVGEYTSIPTMTSSNVDYTLPKSCIENNNGTEITYTTGSTAKYLIIHYANTSSDSATTITNSLATIQVEEGNTKTNFSSFQDLDLKVVDWNTWTRNTTYVLSTGYFSVHTYGKICMVSLNIQIADNTPSNSLLISGLPKGKATRFVFTGALNNGSSLRFYVTEDGEIKNDGQVALSGASGWINSLLVYPIK